MRYFAILTFALALLPAQAFAEAEMRGTVLKVDQTEKQIVLQTDKGEETLMFVSSSKGLSHAKEGSKVAVKFTEKDGTPKIVEVMPQESGIVQILPH
jgi:Cu/Ag efflux protein CusF